MIDIGHKLEVPKRTDIHAWKQLYDQFTTPGYGWDSADTGRGLENKHWLNCNIKRFEDCQQCRKISLRMPAEELESWRTGRWVNELQKKIYR